MSLFLFAKQFVDMFYNLRVLDYIMVAFALILVIYQFLLVKPDIKHSFALTDVIVLLMTVLISATFIRSGNGYQTYFKVVSAFLLYLMGRLFYDRILESTGALVISSYFIVYINFVDRIINFGTNLFSVTDAGGDLYYYDTDMAFAMVLAVIFISMFGKTNLLKMVTVFFTCPYMVICADAGIQVIMLFVIYILLLLYVCEVAFGKQKVFNNIIIGMTCAFVLSIAIVHMPILGVNTDSILSAILPKQFITVANMRHYFSECYDVLSLYNKSAVLPKMFGINMLIDYPIGNLYIKTLYTTGLCGLGLLLGMVVCVIKSIAKVTNRKVFYLCIMVTFLFLGTSVTVNGMESTQMSWFPMLFAGMMISSVKIEERVSYYE